MLALKEKIMDRIRELEVSAFSSDWLIFTT
jgi:hypothetical protein